MSWDHNEPNNVNNEDCAIMLNNGRWADVGCADNRIHPFACNEVGTENWGITDAETGDTIRPRVNHDLAIDAYGTGQGDNVGLWAVHGGSNQNRTGAAQ